MAPPGLDLVAELEAIARALDRAGLAYAVCGGVAVTIHGAVRSTKDIDLVIQREDRAAVLEAIAPLGFVLTAVPMVFGEGTAHAREVQRVSKASGADLLTVDLILAGDLFAKALRDRQVVSWQQTRLYVVSRDDLILMKRLAGRHQDLADIEKLEETRDEQSE